MGNPIKFKVPVKGKSIDEYHCTQCGTKIDAYDKFCRNCGAPITNPTKQEHVYLANIAANLRGFLITCEDDAHDCEEFESLGLKTIMNLAMDELQATEKRMEKLEQITEKEKVM